MKLPDVDVKKILCKSVLKNLGWKIDSSVDEFLKKEPNKVVYIAMPHTSVEDVFLTTMLIHGYFKKAKVMVKSKYFFGPLKKLLYYGNARPIQPGKGLSLTEKIKRQIESGELSHVVMSPDGSKQKRDFINSGWYYIARDLNIPLLMTYLCFKTKSFGCSLIEPPATEKEMLKILSEFYKDRHGKFPSRTSLFRFRSKGS